MNPCESFMNTKAKQKNVTESSGSEKAKAYCGRIFSDIWTNKPKGGERTIPRNHFHAIVGHRTGYKFSNLYETKSGIVEPK